ncbi:UBP1-associated protein 2C isoform X2 [Salvia hispanica]|uniref:UBP1-associated protein 2C isoform X2 n=1 Tax=Salvia hispanica TaxID=49212 RepID=UPI002009351F|nr:UBP1-associated protein 2C isoform X2 [Salvia hispanica]
MDPVKKRKIDETGADGDPLMLTADDARRILDSLTHDQLLEIVQNALLRHPDVLDAVRSLADRDTAQRKLFIRGLGWETTTEKLRALFSSSYGELDEAVVILDKVTGKSKGYGFITFKHIDGAIMALKDPSKKIDGRMTVTQLAAAGISGPTEARVNNPVDVSTRKIYVANVAHDMAAERLLQHFSMYGEIEEGPLGFDKATGKSKGFALFVYKTTEAARASLVDPVKNIDGHQLNCKLAIDGKRGKPPGVQGGNVGNGDGVGNYGGVGGHYGGFSGGPGLSSSSVGSQAAGSTPGVNGGYGSAMGGPYGGGSHIGGNVGAGYGGLGGAGSGVGSGAGLGGVPGGGFPGHGAGMGGCGAGGTGGGIGAAGRGSCFYAGSYQGQHNQIPGALSAPRIPPGGAYQGMPPYY